MENIFIDLGDDFGITPDSGAIIGEDNLLSESETLVGPPGPPGPQGPKGEPGRDGQDGRSATIEIGTTTTGLPGTDASVVNSGTESQAVLNFTIPRGEQGVQGEQGEPGEDGEDGAAATISVGSVQTVAPEYPATVTNSGTTSAAILDFQIPQGVKGETGETGPTGPAGADGADGQAATISVGSTSTGAAGSSASVTNSGTSSAAVLDFVIPKGDTGAAGQNGQDGAAATIAVGTTTTLPAGSSATVTNSGTSSAAVFNFGIPKGSDADMSGTTVALSSYITANSGYSFTDLGSKKFGKLVVLNFDVSGSIAQGETNCGSVVGSILCNTMGAGKTASYMGTNRPASVFLIKNGAVRIYAEAANSAGTFTAILIEA